MQTRVGSVSTGDGFLGKRRWDEVLQQLLDYELEQPWRLTAQKCELRNHLEKSCVIRALRKAHPIELARGRHTVAG